MPKHWVHLDNMFPFYVPDNESFIGFRNHWKKWYINRDRLYYYYGFETTVRNPNHENEIIMQLFISYDLRELLKEHNLYSRIREYIDEQSFSDIFYLDIALDDNSKVSYYDKYKMEKLVTFTNNWRSLYVNHRSYKWCESDTYLHRRDFSYMGKAGKAFKKAIPTLPDSIIQEIAKIFHIPTGKMEVWEGLEDIKTAYHEDNYLSPKGSLGSSCMRYEKCQGYFDIYDDAGCKILVMVDKDKKIHGRAIVWPEVLINGKEYTLVDRIYTINENNEKKFKEYASKQGWIWKDRQSTGIKDAFVIDGNIVYENAEVHSEVNITDYNTVPYFDTFAYLSSDGTFYNHEPSGIEFSTMSETDGSYAGEGNGRVWSEYHDRYIQEDDAVYVESLNSYVECDETTYDEYSGCTILIEDAVELYDDSYTHTDNAVHLRDGSYAHEDDSELIELDNGEQALSSDEDIIELEDGTYTLLDNAVFLEDEEVYVYANSDDIVCDDITGVYTRKVLQNECI